MPPSRPTHPAIPAAAINTAAFLTRPDKVFGKNRVSTDTLRRWADAGRVATITDPSGRMAVEGSGVGPW